MTACLLGFSLYGVYSCRCARPWSHRALCENGGENNVHLSIRTSVLSYVRPAYVRVTCVHRQSLTFHDLRVEHRHTLYPYCTLCIPIPIPVALPRGGFSSLYIDAFYMRERVFVCCTSLGAVARHAPDDVGVRERLPRLCCNQYQLMHLCPWLSCLAVRTQCSRRFPTIFHDISCNNWPSCELREFYKAPFAKSSEIQPEINVTWNNNFI